MKKTIIELFDTTSKLYQNKVAVKSGNYSYTYQDFENASWNFSIQLQNIGCKPHEYIGICLNRSFEMVLGIFGILRMGCAYVPTDPTNPSKRIQSLYKSANIKYVVTTQNLKPFIEEMGFIAVVPEIITEYQHIENKTIVSPDDNAYVLFTSGSTGTPKGVIIAHHSVVNLCEYIQDRYPINQGDIVLLKSPYTFDGSIWELFGWLLMGGTLYICNPGDEKNPKNLCELINKEQINFMFFVPSMLSVFLDYAETLNDSNTLSSLKWVSVGGEVLTPTLVKHFYKAINNETVRLFNVYGPTETCVYATTYLCDPNKEYTKLPIGELVTNDYIYILDENLKQVGFGEEGEICIGGRGVAKGYLNLPEFTNEKFITDPIKGEGFIYRTGDIGKELPNGLFDFIGRKDFQVKLRGLRIEMGEIEIALQNIPEVLECVVLFAKDRNNDDSLIAYLRISATNTDKNYNFRVADAAFATHIKSTLKDSIPEYMIPNEYIICDIFPINQNGKIDRNALPSLQDFNLASEKTEYQATNETEEIVYNIWKKLLSKEFIAENEDFFQAGGHSLKAIQVITEIIKTFHIEIPLCLFYDNMTLQKMCNFIAQNKKDTENQLDYKLKKNNDTNIFPITPVQKEMWIMNNFDPTGLTHNIQVEFTVKDKIDIPRFLDAITKTIQSEETFRSTFPIHEQEPIQLIHEEIKFEIPITDLIKIGNKEKIYENIISQNGNVVFNFNELPLFSFHLIKWTENEIKLLMAIHHIIFDGWSLSLFMQKVSSIYNGETIPERKYRNGDYALWLNEYVGKNGYEKEFKYWEKALEHIPNRITLPTKSNADFSKAGNYGRRYWFSIDIELTTQIENFSIANNTTPYVVLMSAYQIALSKHAKQREIVVGSPFANRLHPMTSELIGYYTNMISIRSEIRDNDNFDEFIKRCNTSSIGSFSNALLPFGELVKKLNIKFAPGIYPIYQTIFVMQNWPHENSNIHNFNFTQKEIGNNTSKIDLILNVEKSNQKYECWIEYDIMLYDQDFIEKITDDINHILQQITIDSKQNILAAITSTNLNLSAESKNTSIIIGEGSLAVYCCDLLLKNNFTIKKIITEDKNLIDFSKKYNITTSNNIHESEDEEPVDYIFSINNSVILKPWFLQKAKRLAINYHDSPLPRYAGMYATSHAILHGETTHGISWHLITDEVDAGDIVASSKVEIQKDDTAYSLNIRCYEAAIDCFKQVISNIKNDKIILQKQDLTKRTLFPLSKRPNEFGIINWNSNINEIETLIRACNYGNNLNNEFLTPSIWQNNKFYSLIKSRIIHKKISKPGLISIENNQIAVNCKNGCVLIEKINNEYGEEIEATDLLIPGQIISTTNTIRFERINILFQKWAKYEQYWVKQFAGSNYFTPSFTSESQENNWQSINISAFKWIKTNFESSSITETLESIIMYYFLRLSRINAGTFGYINENIENDLPFGKWKPINIEISGDKSNNTNISNIIMKITEINNHGNYCTNIIERYCSLNDLRGKMPLIYIIKDKFNIPFASQNAILINVNDESIQIKGISISVIEALNSFIQILEHIIMLPAKDTMLMSENLLSKTKSKQNELVCKPKFTKDLYLEFLNSVDKFGNKLAIYDSGNEYTYYRLKKEVSQLATVLKNNKVNLNTVVAINIDRRYEFFLSMMAILHCGAIFLPVDPKLPLDRQKYIIQDSDAVLLVYHKESMLIEQEISKVDISTIDLSLQNEAEPYRPENNTLAYIMYTSGSTGKPKGVKINRLALSSFTSGALSLYQINETDRILQFSNLSFDASLEEIFCAFCSGASLYLRNEEMLESENLLSFTIENNITLWDLPTAFWRQLISSEAYNNKLHLTNLKTVIIGGEATTISDFQQWSRHKSLKHKLFNTYGPTETTIVALAFEMNLFNESLKDIPIGNVFPGCSVSIVDNFGFQLPQGVAGEMIIAGTNVSDGYIHASKEQNLAFGIDSDNQSRYYKTGDLVSSDPNGYIHYKGRVDEQLKIRGFRIEPKEIEIQLLKIKGIENALVYGFTEQDGNKILIAFYTGKSVQNDELFVKKQLQEVLPSYMVPGFIMHINEIPLTRNGKADKNSLNQFVINKYSSQSKTFKPPVGKIETALHQLWCSVFKKENIGVEDDFFEIGGHSLNAVQLMSGIKQKFNLDLPLSALISNPNIRKLSEIIESNSTEHLWDVIVPIRRKGKLPPLFLIHGAGLNVLLYQSLSKHLESDRPIYALQARGLDGKQTISTSIEEMANHYIGEIKKIQPIGPYHFLGFSLGGFIAFEMARILESRNEKDNFIGVIDSVASHANENFPLIKKLIIKISHLIIVPIYIFWLFLNEPMNKKKQFLKSKLKNLSLIFTYYSRKSKIENKELNPVDKSAPVYLNSDLRLKLMGALKRYILKPSSVKIDLFKASKPSFYIPNRKTYGWSKYALKGVNSHSIPGEHSNMFAPPNDKFFAQVLNKQLKECELKESK